jgi:chromosome segregation ATPase
MSEFHDLDRRVAVLEQIARDTAAALGEIRAELRAMRSDIDHQFGDIRNELRAMRSDIDHQFGDIRTELRDLRAELNRSVRWLLGLWFASLGAVLAVMAHGFHWI